MAAKQVGNLIREARTKAGLTQEKLAQQVGGLTAAEISKAERGETELSQAMLKKIARATGVTQALLLDAAKAGTAKPTAKTAAKTGTAKTAAKTTTGKTAAKTDTAKTAAKSTTAKKKPKTPASAGLTMKVTSTEKRMVELYREADTKTRQAAMKVLKGESTSLLEGILGKDPANAAGDVVQDLLGNVLGGILGGK